MDWNGVKWRIVENRTSERGDRNLFLAQNTQIVKSKYPKYAQISLPKISKFVK